MNNNKCRSIVYLVAICVTLAGSVIASDQIHAESLAPSKIASASSRTHYAPAVSPVAAAQGEFAPKASIGSSLQAPNHILHPAVMVAVADSSLQPAVSAPVGSLEGGILAANAGALHDDMPAVTGDMTRETDRAINTQGETADNRADSAGLPYAVAVVLVVFLAMVLVMRRDTRA